MKKETPSFDKPYDPSEIEKSLYASWEQSGYFKPSGEGHGESYCIMLPPPNVTGSLHMGHGFGFTLIDVLIRYERMMGKKVLWQAGTDHAGIATQMVVERQLNANNQTRHDLGRDAFVEKIWRWKEESGGNITRQLRRLGASTDWDREKFTMDPTLSHAVRHVFIQLYEEGLIYRGNRLVNWDPVLLTAISDLEVINEEEKGSMWYIRYPLENNPSEFIVVATTRPETMLGDVAVAVHPDDARYQALIGKMIALPLTNRVIPIIADEAVDPAFGTGCVKITPAHDFNDYAIGQRHQLTPINIFTPTAHLNDNAPEAYQGLERMQARKTIIEALELQNLIEKIEPHTLKVPRGDRSNAIIEPYLTHQWYVKSKPLAEAAIKAVENGDMKFVPENWDKTFYQWMRNIEDWCISRQLWWGHRIPVWYDEEGKVYVGQDETDVRKKYHLTADIALKQDDDVLDTWFSAALWPFSSLGWPEKTPDFDTFFPTQTLITGFDIIFFWVARMLMMSLKFTGKVPFKEVYITGLIRDAEGHKMSKSKGNVLDPIDLIDGISLEDLIQKRTYGLMQPKMAEKITKNTKREFPEGIQSYGTDALRFTFCSFASYTREIRFDINRLAGFRNFCNKLWNAARYVSMNTDATYDHHAQKEFSLVDQWIQSKLQETIRLAHEAIAQYRFDLFAHILYDFTWNEFCDWYLELSKPILTQTDTSEALKQGTRYTLLSTLETILRSLHPIMPYITETLWQPLRTTLNLTEETIMRAAYPQYEAGKINENANQQIQWIKSFITEIRAIRSQLNLSPGKLIPLLARSTSKLDQDYLNTHERFIKTLAKIESVQWLKTHENPPPSATAVSGSLELFVPLAGVIDLNAEKNRLEREIGKYKQAATQLETKLGNPQFTDKAPSAVVEGERSKLAELNAKIETLTKQYSELDLINTSSE